MRFLMLSLSVVFGVGAAVAACGGSDETGGSFCEPAAFVFCRCSNGDAGSKECNSDGTEFGQCMSQDGGECPERDDDAASSGDPTSSGDPSSSSSSSGAGGATGDGELYAACESADQCQSGDCHPDGYCTQQCANYQECKWPNGDCPGSMAPPALVQTCVPTCGVFKEETKMFEPDPDACGDLYCGYTTAADNFGILVCGSRGSWADGVPLPPDGSECDSDTWGNDQCSLGYSGAEAVCTGFGVCAVGCYENGDCPQGETCSQSNGTLGSCK
jgi:hypothetical protein